MFNPFGVKESGGVALFALRRSFAFGISDINIGKHGLVYY
jgi:hypothetical protein